MPCSVEIQVTREVCTTASPASFNGTSVAAAAGATVAFPQQAHARRSSIPAFAPPAYEGAAILTAMDSNDSTPPPDYTKFTETTRAERCFYYGFLFCPIWIYGFLHFWTAFSSTPQAIPSKEAELPRWINPATGLPAYSTPSPTSTPSSPSQKTFSWRQGSSPTSTSRQCVATVLMMNRPDVYSVWRREEKKWALRSGYAMAASWGLLLMFLFICVQTGVFGFSFSQ